MSAIKEQVAAISETKSSGRRGDKTMTAAAVIEEEQEKEGAESQAGEHKKDEKQGLKIAMRHFESALQKIKKRTTAVSNPGLV